MTAIFVWRILNCYVASLQQNPLQPKKFQFFRFLTMSLFKSREWWSVSLSENENYDSQSILVFTLGKDPYQSILLGNHLGVLRLFSPNSEVTEEGTLPYNASHLLLEVNLPAPILQINEGILVSGSLDKHLAVLHPRLFSVYAIRKKESKETNMGDQIMVELAYQHVLRHSAHSFVLGSFGGVQNRSFICIQSLDGLLSFYEQESFAFQLYLPSFIIPYPFSYMEKTDSFLFLSGFLTFDCYSYEALASAASSNDKKISKTWEFNLCEEIWEIFTMLKDDPIIVIISDRNLFGLNEHGKMIFMKRLEYKPVACFVYIVEENKNLMVITASDEGFLNFYECTNLKWSMKIDCIPVAIKRIFLKGLQGGIVSLSENGLLQVIYIGTHPSLYLVPPLVQPDIDIQKATDELKLLQRKIVDNEIVDLPSTQSVEVSLKVSNVIVQNDTKVCNIMVEIDPQSLVNKLQALFLVEPPLVVSNQSTTVESCSEKISIESSVRVEGTGAISSLVVTVTVICLTSEGVVSSIQKNELLPLSLVLVEAAAMKEAQHKMTITSNKPVCGINQLFGEFQAETPSANVIGLKFVNSDNVVTILAAKSSQRYRIQSDSLESVSLLVKTLLERLKLHFRREPDFSLTLLTPLPLDVYFEKIELFHEITKRKKSLEEELSKQTAQFRMVQKKILMNLKDVTPKSNLNLYKILKDTTGGIKNTLDKLEDSEKKLYLLRCSLSSLSRLLLTLLELMNVKEEDLQITKIVFFPHMDGADDQGWLEVQEATASFLLHTILAKSVRDKQKPTFLSLEPLADASKLTRHFSSVIERITKGLHLMEKQEFEWKEHLTTIQGVYELEEISDDVIPMSCKLTDFESSKKVKSDEKQNASNETKQDAIKEETNEEIKSKIDDLEKVQTSPSKQERKPEREMEKKGEDDDDGIWDIKLDEMRI